MPKSQAMQGRIFVVSVVTILLLLSPAAAHADAGIPMLPFAYPVVLVFLLPVIGIEAWYIRKKLRTPWGNTLVATAKANVVTLVPGFPLTWLICFGFEFLFWLGASSSKVLDRFLDHPTAVTEVIATVMSAPWLGPTEDIWAIPVAFVALLVPSFLFSGLIESMMMRRYNWLEFEGDSARAIWQANILSYLFLAAVGFVGLRVVMKV